MKFRFVALASVLLSTLTMAGQRNVPHGVIDNPVINNAWDRLDMPPQETAKPQSVRSARLQRDAQELAKLAQLIPSEIHQVENGLLPKDLDGQLNRIEKLSKQLRREISR